MRIINRTVPSQSKFTLGAIPFVLVLIVYAVASHIRRAENPADKLLPSFEAMGSAFYRLAFTPDRRSGDYVLWVDTFDSLARLGSGLAVSTAFALLLGVSIGFIPYIRASLAPFISALSLIPPITILPILFIIFGLGEVSKIMLIVIGTMPVMVRSTAQAVLSIPREMIIKAESLGASVWQITTRVILPQTLPHLITAIRLGLVPAWIFLISAEAIASTSGLGYRIFLVRRFLAMDVILPYVLWTTLLAYIIDRLLLALSKRSFKWHHLSGESL